MSHTTNIIRITVEMCMILIFARTYSKLPMGAIALFVCDLTCLLRSLEQENALPQY